MGGRGVARGARSWSVSSIDEHRRTKKQHIRPILEKLLAVSSCVRDDDAIHRAQPQIAVTDRRWTGWQAMRSGLRFRGWSCVSDSHPMSWNTGIIAVGHTR